MKFKSLIIISAAIFLIIILIIALFPMLLSGIDIPVNLRPLTLPLMLFTGALLAGILVYFIINYRLLSLLEREDWPALAYYLEQQIFVKGRYKAANIRLLASSYLVISDYSSIVKLENKTMLSNPSAVYKNALIFGAAHILNGDHIYAAGFFMKNLENVSAGDKQWTRWYYGFSQLLNSVFSAAEEEFKSLALASNDVLITGLSSYFLYTTLYKRSFKQEECISIAEKGRTRVKKSLGTQKAWIKEADGRRTDIHIAIIRKYVLETGDWIFNNEQWGMNNVKLEESGGQEAGELV